MFETVLSALFDRYPVLRNKKTMVTALLSVVEFLLGLLLVCNVRQYSSHYFKMLPKYVLPSTSEAQSRNANTTYLLLLPNSDVTGLLVVAFLVLAYFVFPLQ